MKQAQKAYGNIIAVRVTSVYLQNVYNKYMDNGRISQYILVTVYHRGIQQKDLITVKYVNTQKTGFSVNIQML